MTPLPQELIDHVLGKVEIREVLDFLNYRTETIQQTDKAIRCFCPVHKEQVFRTLSFDTRTRKGKCSYTPCPAHASHNIIDLVAMTHEVEPLDAVAMLAGHFNLDIDFAQYGLQAPQVVEPEAQQAPEGKAPKEEKATEPAQADVESEEEEPESTLDAEAVAETILEKPEPLAPPPPPKPMTPLDAAAQAVEAGDLEVAARQLTSMVERDSGNLDALEMLVDVLQKLGDEAALETHQNSLAQLYANRNRIDDACRLYGDIIASHPEDIELRLRYAECLHRQNDNPAMIEQMFTVGDLFEKSGEWDKALEIYRRIDAFQPDIEATAQAIERVLIKSGRKEEASALILQQAHDMLQSGNVDGAIKRFSSVLKIDETRDDVRLRMIQTILAREDMDESQIGQCLDIIDGFSDKIDQAGVVDTLEEINQRFPENTTIIERLYQVYQTQGRQGDADQFAFDLANYYFDNGDLENATKWVDVLIEADGAGIANALALKAEICRQQSDIPGILEAMTRIIDLQEDRGQAALALPIYQSVLELEPDSMEMQVRYLWALQKAGQEEKFIERGVAILPSIMELPPAKSIEILSQLFAASEAAPAATRVTITRAYARNLQDTGKSTEARDLLLEATDSLLESSEFDQAVEILEGLMVEDDNDLTVLEKLADAHVGAGNQDRAMQIYRSLAELYGEQGALDQQLDVLLKVVESHPEDVEILTQMLGVYDQIGNVRDAREMRLKLARLHARRDEHRLALPYVEALLEYDGTDQEMLSLAIVIYEALDKKEELREVGMRLLDIYLADDDAKQAVRLAAKLEKSFPGDADLLIIQIRALAMQESFDECVALVDQQIQEGEASGNQKATLDFMRRILDISADLDAKILARWVEQCLRTVTIEENWPETEEMLDRVVGHMDFEALVEIVADVIVDRPDFAPARTHLVLLLESAGRNAEAIDALRDWARHCVKDGDNEQANRYYQLALDKAPDDVDVLSEVVNFRSEAGLKDGLADLCARLAKQLETSGLVSQAIQVLEIGLKHQPRRKDLRQRILLLDEMIATPEKLKKRYAEMTADKMNDGDFISAQSVLVEAINRFPMELDQRYKLVDLLRDMGLQGEMLTELGNIAQIQAETGDLEGASETINDVLEIDPDNLRAQAIQAEIHDQLGDEKRALTEYRDISRKIATQSAAHKPKAVHQGRDKNEDTLTMLPINEHYSFEHFIVGSRNNFAFATAKAIADNPGGDYNPLFLHGDVGLGKTHLLQAILIHLRQNHPKLAVLYTSSEEFTNALIDAIQNNTVRDFRKIYKSADCLLIDDVHFLGEKERAQEEFFQIFNTLYQAGKQIVLTCDRPPKEIPHLERRLRSRFGAGIIVDIQSPDLETRVAIVRSEAEAAGIEIDDVVINHIAERISTNVRELKSVLNQILARTRIGSESLTPELVTEIVGKVAAGVDID